MSDAYISSPGAVIEPAARSAVSQPATPSAISWAAVFAGGVTAAALGVLLLAFGSGMGFLSVSPWSNSGMSAGTFTVAAGIYAIVAAMLSCTVGGYVAGRLRTKWVRVHSEEVLFRDTAHGFLSWALATVFGAAILGSAATYLVGGAASPQGAGQAAQSTGPTAYFSDMLLRPTSARSTAAAAGDPTDLRREVETILSYATSARGTDVPAGDRTYLAQLVSTHTGLSRADAEKRVSDVITAAKAAADKARKAAASFLLWLTAAMFVGAFAASLAAIEGGQLRDGRWSPVIGGRNYRGDVIT